MTNTDWQPWAGRTESGRDVVTPTPVAALAATLDRDDSPPAAGDPLPPLWHWRYFLPLHRQAGDGHATLALWAAHAEGGFAMDATATLR